jgi:hypothetical protein
MSTSVTAGRIGTGISAFARTRLTVIYDRLRKRSYRRGLNWARANGWQFVVKKEYDSWNAFDHAAYTQGVRDALNAVEAQASDFDRIMDAV